MPNLPDEKNNELFSIKNQSNDDLFTMLDNAPQKSVLEICLIELLRRSVQKIEDLQKEIEYLKHPRKSNPKKRKVYYFNDKELDDDYLIHLIDNDYISISELERDLKTKKNVLRNRYHRAKKRLEPESW